MRGRCDNKEEDLNWAHPFPRVRNIREGVTLQKVGVLLYMQVSSLARSKRETLPRTATK